MTEQQVASKTVHLTFTRQYKAWVAAILALLLCTPGLVLAKKPLVEITGGADVAGNNYSWEVTNLYSSPIVHIEFPHYAADLFRTPDGWKQETVNLINVGVPDEPGVCTAFVKQPNLGIRQGGRAKFGMRINIRKAMRKNGTVTVRFADGTETLVEGVELPNQGQVQNKHMALIGTAVIFGGWVAFRTLRQRGKAKKPPNQ